MEGLLPDVLQEISKPEDGEDDLDTAVEITDVQYLASYSWTGRKAATIIVPGASC